jgi:hypothetical protein
MAGPGSGGDLAGSGGGAGRTGGGNVARYCMSAETAQFAPGGRVKCFLFGEPQQVVFMEWHKTSHWGEYG